METITFIQQLASPTLDHFFRLMSGLGSTRAYIVLLLGAYLALDARLGQRLGIFVLVGFYLNFHLKGLVGTERPFLIDPSVARTPEAVPTSGPGFPSGHAQLSVTFWGYAAWWLSRRWFWAVALLVVALISLSRLYLGMHFLVDVVGGLAIGAVYTAAAAFAEPFWLSLRSVSKPLRAAVGFFTPLALLLALPPPGLEAGLIMGALAAFGSAPLLMPYTPPQGLWRRLLVAVIGIALVFAALSASSLLLTEAVKRSALGGFFRYVFIAYIGLYLTPWFAQAVRLAPKPLGTNADAKS